jgi:hypothetical protein
VQSKSILMLQDYDYVIFLEYADWIINKLTLIPNTKDNRHNRKTICNNLWNKLPLPLDDIPVDENKNVATT